MNAGFEPGFWIPSVEIVPMVFFFFKQRQFCVNYGVKTIFTDWQRQGAFRLVYFWCFVLSINWFSSFLIPFSFSPFLNYNFLYLICAAAHYFHFDVHIHKKLVATGDYLNPLRAAFFRGNINIYLHFVSLLHIDMTQVLKILPQGSSKTYQDLHILHSQYYCCWCPGDVRSRGISSHDIDLVKQR